MIELWCLFLVLINSKRNKKLDLLDDTFIHEWLKMSTIYQVDNGQYFSWSFTYGNQNLIVKKHLSLFQVYNKRVYYIMDLLL